MRTSLDITFGAQCVECGDFIQLTRVAWDPQALELFVGVSPCGKCLGAAKLNPVDFVGLEDSWKRYQNESLRWAEQRNALENQVRNLSKTVALVELENQHLTTRLNSPPWKRKEKP